jgi:hypothetical protein
MKLARVFSVGAGCSCVFYLTLAAGTPGSQWQRQYPAMM